MRSLPQGVDLFFSGQLPWGVEPPSKSQIQPPEQKLFALFVSRAENHICVMEISTMFMLHNSSISLLAAPGSAECFPAHVDPPRLRYNYDV